jgi:mannose-6-phosphate isomerase-like protein (cupin superfamily)
MVMIERERRLKIRGDELFFTAYPEETGGAYLLLEMQIAPGGGPPTHLHHGDAESFVVLEGNFRIQQGDVVRDVGPGAFVFGAPGVPHGFTNIGTSTGRLLVIDAPPKIEPYFRALAAHCAADTLTFEVQQELYREHGMEWVGPNLATGGLQPPR